MKEVITVFDVGEFVTEVYQLMQAAYQIEADLLGVDDFFPLTRPAAHIGASANRFFGFFQEGELFGVCEIETITADQFLIASLVVSPQMFRQGIGSKLMGYVCRLYPAKRLLVSTAVANEPAVLLYQKLGFVVLGHETLPDGMRLIKLVRSGTGKAL